MEWHLIASVTLSSLGLGLVSGWHCAGMCGAIAALSPIRTPMILYHSGRALGYLTLGALSGRVGHQFYLSWEEPKNYMVGTVLVTLLLLYIFSYFKKAGSFSFFYRLLSNLPQPLRSLTIGVSTALLPCHLLYGFLAVAAASRSPLAGALVLLSLWLTSALYLLGFSFIARWLHQWKLNNPHATRTIQWTFFAALAISLIAHYLPHQ